MEAVRYRQHTPRVRCDDAAVVLLDSDTSLTLFAAGSIRGIDHARGDKMRTWHVVRELGAWSYIVTNNEQYKVNITYITFPTVTLITLLPQTALEDPTALKVMPASKSARSMERAMSGATVVAVSPGPAATAARAAGAGAGVASGGTSSDSAPRRGSTASSSSINDH